MSGYVDPRALADADFAEELPFLRKPFTPASLLTKVRQVLDSRANN
jgi:hypothetical protein